MVRIVFAAVFVALAVVPASAQQKSPISADIGARVAAGFVEPAVAAMAEAANAERASIHALCDVPSAGALEAARRDFARLVPAWGMLSVLRFGPLVADNRFERIFFWPDPRGVILRQVQGVLADEDVAATDPVSLTGKSVAVQGLPALEFLLFGGGSEDLVMAAPFRCAYARAIADNVSTMADEIADDWREANAFVDSFVAPAPEKSPYRSPQEVAGEIVKALVTTLQFVRTAELLPAFGDTIEDARGRRAPFWRSDLTFSFKVAQVDGLIAAMEAAGFLEHGGALATDLAASIRFELRTARTALDGVAASGEDAFGDQSDRGRINLAMIALEGANHALSEQFSAAIGLTMGFNALDGD